MSGAFISLGKCDCCQKEQASGAAASGYVPMSFAWCNECLTRHVEPEMVLQYLYYMVGDHGEGLVPAEQLPGTYKDNKYWTWQEYADWCKQQPDPEMPE